jgi:predicted ATPase/DNA-binding CsgD family transcriptional regulator
LPERPATHTAAAPVGTTFIAASANDHEGLRAVLDEAAAAHGGERWADEEAAFRSAPDALAGALAARRLWQRDAHADGLLRVAVHAEGALRDGAEGRYRGPGVSRSRRLREIAAPGQVLVSATAAGDPPVGATLHDVGIHRLRDLSPPLRIFALLDGDEAAQPLRSLDAYPNNLPSRPTTFVGRDAELAELLARLPSTRLLTIVGPGGSGKTRLAAQLAAEQVGRWDDGVWWVGLEELVEPSQVAGSVARALDVLVDPASGAVESLRAQLATKRLLLCLDNCEHVLDAAAQLADGLYRDCPDVTILATAREPLGLTGEAAWRLGPMAAPEARALFLERAVHAAPDLAVDGDDDAAITSMSSRLDGSPLALELAAAWLRTLTPRQIEAGLDDRFALLVRSPRDAVPRHASLLASIAWSHDLLGAEDQAVLRRLAVFAGDFDVAAAQVVCAGDGAAVLGAIARLVDKSLVVARVADGDVRYRLPETIREYAVDRLRAAGERRDASDRLLDHLLARARGAAPDLDRDKDRWRTTIGRDYENLRAAIEHGLDADDPERGRRLAAELPWLWHLNRQGREGLDILRRAIARAPDERSALQARLLAGIALVADTAGPLDVEVDAARRAAELAAEHGDDRLLALCLALEAVGRLYTDLDAAREASLEAERVAEAACEPFVVDAGRALRGIVAHLRDEHAEAGALLAEAAERLAARGDRGVASTALAFHSGSARLTGDVAMARELAERSIATAAQLADHLRIGMGRSALGLALGTGGDVAAGLAVLEPVRPLVADPSGKRFLPEVNRALGLLHLWAGEPQEAIRWLTAEASSTDGGQPTYLALRTLPALASAQRQAGEPEAAWESASRAVELARARGMPSPLAEGLVEQARLRAQDRESAGALHHEALRIRADRGLWPGVVESLEELAALSTSTPEQDVRLLAAAAAARAALELPVRPIDRAGAIELAAALREELGAEHDEAWRVGAALSLEEAAAYAGRGRGSRRRPDNGWDSLTSTELEVVRLAVDGLTNPEIGARLFMSRGTVKTHLSHVYAKLDVSNRTELAALAAGQLGRADVRAARSPRS